MEKRQHILQWMHFVVIIAAGLSTALGGLVLIGWYTHSVSLIQVWSTFVPMQFNTALGFLLCGIGLFSQSSGHKRLAVVCGVTVGTVGSLTMLQYVSGADFGIDQLFMKHYITVKSSHPGRMAPNTAICFFFSGVALAVRNNFFASRRRHLMVWPLGSIVIALGLAAFIGYLGGVETAYGWGALTQMAVHTSAGFIVLGTGIFMLAWREGVLEDSTNIVPPWFSIAAGLGMISIVVIFWQALFLHHNAPDAPVHDSHSDFFTYSILVMGLLMSVLLVLVIRFAQASSRRAAELEEATLELERDIIERKHSEESIKHLAYYDHLTGLPNRLLFTDRLDHLLLREAWKQRTAAVLFLDIDRFKTINDSLGHSYGDELLRVVASRLEECLREGDTVGRFGGDEFTILLHDLAKVNDIAMVLEKILNTIKQPIVIEGQEVKVTASIGVSVFPNDGSDGGTLLKNADIAMYRAKSEGKNNYKFFSLSMSVKATELLKVERKLSKALDNGGFILHYQPEIDLKTGEFVGMEALVRLIDQEDGKLTPPGDFIPVAEETGIIIPLSELILRTACQQNKAWQDAGYPSMTIAVNISPKVFRQNNFIQIVADIIKETGLKPEYLEIEITEETMLTDTEETLETMGALKEIGVRFAIDDFGTGYSSLSYIKMLPIRMLKIDRAFIRDLNDNPDDKAIVTAIIQMAHSMGLEVLAEGVETKEQLAFLNSLGCDKLQGYLVSKPVPYDEFENLLKEAPGAKKDMMASA